MPFIVETDSESYKLLLEKSRKARSKFVDPFLCKKLSCSSCSGSVNPASSSLPCTLSQPRLRTGQMLQLAFLTCVRAREPGLREQAITTFRSAARVDDSQEGSDIKKMVEMTPERWMTILGQLKQFDLELVTNLAGLLYSALQAAIKLSRSNWEKVVKSTLTFQEESQLRVDDKLVHETLLGQDGIYGFLNQFSLFLLLTMSEHRKYRLPAEMFQFNTDICAALITIYRYGTETFPWMEAMVMNFIKIFRYVWTTPLEEPAPPFKVEIVKPVISKQQSKLQLAQSIIPRCAKNSDCNICHKKLNKIKLFPLCFQSSTIDCYYPREVAYMKRPRDEWMREVNSTDIDRWSRVIASVCSRECLLTSLQAVSPKLLEIQQLRQEEQGEFWPTVHDRLGNLINGLRYFSFKCLIEHDLGFRIRRPESRSTEEPRETRALPGASPARQPTLPPIPKAATQYFGNLLLHGPLGGCEEHPRLWGGWLRYHPTLNMEKYRNDIGTDGFSKESFNYHNSK